MCRVKSYNGRMLHLWQEHYLGDLQYMVVVSVVCDTKPNIQMTVTLNWE